MATSRRSISIGSAAAFCTTATGASCRSPPGADEPCAVQGDTTLQPGTRTICERGRRQRPRLCLAKTNASAKRRMARGIS